MLLFQWWTTYTVLLIFLLNASVISGDIDNLLFTCLHPWIHNTLTSLNTPKRFFLKWSLCHWILQLFENNRMWSKVFLVSFALDNPIMQGSGFTYCDDTDLKKSFSNQLLLVWAVWSLGYKYSKFRIIQYGFQQLLYHLSCGNLVINLISMSPWFPHLCHEDNDICLIGLLGKFKQMKYIEFIHYKHCRHACWFPGYWLQTRVLSVIGFFQKGILAVTGVGGPKKTGSQRLILSNGLINMPSVRPPNPSPAPVRFLYSQAQWADGFRTDGRRAPEETNMVPALSLLCDYAWSLGRKQAMCSKWR